MMLCVFIDELIRLAISTITVHSYRSPTIFKKIIFEDPFLAEQFAYDCSSQVNNQKVIEI